jgi:Tn3 transposase DDE domain
MTRYLQDAIDASRAEGNPVSNETIAHLSPARFETINPYGAYTIDVPSILYRGQPGPLRIL